jgi:hypothetical protein
MSPRLPDDIRRVDPAQAWMPWAPDDRDPFDARQAGHLLRRAAFGASPERIAAAVRAGPEPTIKLLLLGTPGHEKDAGLFDDVGSRFAELGNADKLRGWWLSLMLTAGHPLREKLSLFWHDHFATSITKVRSAKLMFRQNRLLRKHALGRFGPFLRDMGRDVAMLLWLDSNQNVKARPNENYAREVMELFSLGVGNYTEKDIQEAARAFTGYHTDDEQEAFHFNADEHDAGSKAVLGKTGKFDGDAIVPVLLAQPACARFLARKLYREFVSEEAPPPALLEPLAKRLRDTEYDLSAAVGTILRSRLFFSPHAFLKRVKSPVEYVLGAVQAAWPGPVAPSSLVNPLKRMGMELFAPPNVKGWPGGRDWLNTSTILARNNFADRITTGQAAPMGRPPRAKFGSIDLDVEDVPGVPDMIDPKELKGYGPREPMAELERPPAEPRDPPPAFDVAARFKKIDPTKPADIADGLLDTFLPGCASAGLRKAILAHIQEDEPTGAHLRGRIREAAHAVLCSAESQLC